MAAFKLEERVYVVYFQCCGTIIGMKTDKTGTDYIVKCDNGLTDRFCAYELERVE